MTDLAQRRKEAIDLVMREAVYEGAVAVLTEHGLQGATMERVAAAAGVAKGSLYNYFRNKRELLRFVHQRALVPIQQAVERILQGTQQAREKLLSLCRIWREYLGENRAVFEFFVNDEAARSLVRDSQETARASAVQQVAAIISQGVQEGVFRAVDARGAAEVFVGAAVGMVEHELASGRLRPMDEAVEILMDVMLRGLLANPSETPGRES